MSYRARNKQSPSYEVFFLPALLLLSSISVEASDVVARVVKATGEAWVVTGSHEREKLADNDSVEKNAVVSTGKDSSVSLLLNDHSLIKMGSSSRLELAFTAKTPDQVDLKLTEGMLKSVVKKRLDKTRWFRVHTPAATMGVRGTEFVTTLTTQPSAESGGELKLLREQVLVTSGSVEVTDNSGKALSLVKSGTGIEFTVSMSASGAHVDSASLKSQTLSAGQTETLKSDKFLTAPKPLPPLSSAAASGALSRAAEGNPANGGAPAPIRGMNNSLAPGLGGEGATANPATGGVNSGSGSGSGSGTAGMGGAAPPLAPPPRPPVAPPPPLPPGASSGSSGK
jgi:hypothetical protein